MHLEDEFFGVLNYQEQKLDSCGSLGAAPLSIQGRQRGGTERAAVECPLEQSRPRRVGHGHCTTYSRQIPASPGTRLPEPLLGGSPDSCRLGPWQGGWPSGSGHSLDYSRCVSEKNTVLKGSVGPKESHLKSPKLLYLTRHS